MSYALILKIIESFYDKAKSDVMIGYHFRFIEDFETHIPRIADFWNLQLNGELNQRSNLPFKLIDVHSNIGIKRGEIGRWMTLFTQNLEEFQSAGDITSEHLEKFKSKSEHFRKKIEEKILN